MTIAVLAAALLAPLPGFPTSAALVAEINRVRADPPAYAAELGETRERYQGRLYRGPDGERVMTDEGLAAVDEAIAFLRVQAPLPPLRQAPPLDRSSRAHALDLERTGDLSHAGSDGSTMAQRIGREGYWQGMAGENIAFGLNDAAGVVRQLIVDDGVADRGHRANLFSPLLKVAGGACAAHIRYRQVCVMDYATGIADKADVRGAQVPEGG